MPAWEDIRPSAIKLVLPILWSWKFDRATGEFIGRLAGERIQTVFGRVIRNARMSDVFEGHDFLLALRRHTRVAMEPAFFRGRGLVFQHLGRFDIGERIILPLATEGTLADGIIGATAFQSELGAPPEKLVRKGEIEHWYTVD